jgi:hypothetical protein
VHKYAIEPNKEHDCGCEFKRNEFDLDEDVKEICIRTPLFGRTRSLLMLMVQVNYLACVAYVQPAGFIRGFRQKAL